MTGLGHVGKAVVRERFGRCQGTAHAGESSIGWPDENYSHLQCRDRTVFADRPQLLCVDFDECVVRVAGELTGAFEVKRERLAYLEMFSGLLLAV